MDSNAMCTKKETPKDVNYIKCLKRCELQGCKMCQKYFAWLTLLWFSYHISGAKLEGKSMS